jgi:hypothetical protein
MSAGKTYGKSLTRLEGAPQDRSFGKREFAGGGSATPQGITRRTVPFGRDACGRVVKSNEGRSTKIEGNEMQPSTGEAAT